MRLLASLLALALLGLSLPLAAAAEQPVSLALKLAPGEVLTYDLTFSGGGALVGPDGSLATLGLRGNMSLRQTVTEALPAGGGRVEVTIPRLRADITLGDQTATFDFADGRLRWFANGKESPAPEDEVLRALPLLGLPVSAAIAGNGAVSDVVFPGPPAGAKLPDLGPGFDLNALWRCLPAPLPDGPVRVGETWTSNTSAYLGGSSGLLVIQSSRTLDELTEQGGVRLARLSSYTEARLRDFAVPSLPSGLGFTMKELRKTVTGTEFMDTSAGRWLRADYDVGLRASFEVRAAEEVRPGSLEARLRVSVQAR